MKRVFFALCAVGLLAGSAFAQEPAKTAPKTDLEKLSYALGATIGENIGSTNVKLDLAQLMNGLSTSYGDGELALTPEELATSMRAFEGLIRAEQEKVMKAEAEKSKLAAEKNKTEGAKYLAENAKKEGVKTTESGLQYQVLKAGDGPSPKATDRVKAHYHGTFINGDVFDSSVERGEPLTIPVNRVIAGWSEALQLMKVGDKYRLVIPSELAYGEEQLPGSPIQPNSVLVFEVELLGIEE
ncbi:FKBP-type peptidyl-prolyl cis-trans isomerase [Lignipirellula cremea]|uniref:Peptidyl-prolyl cis-trans isomerase n=1 Tax=Lignipirellula cremea TaxID=2528010 RepID=A0A518DWR4_9BACT|nr:FKBP-type peptidyl-prolyl cis-trans isomerase [Lignipirellula cremea]QDU96279.1 Peptidyl-prolyl cis-trans isomerase Mip precursor [Lignipirellula cremea]